ncbi:Helicase conserved C-terminal domain-containing protein [Desulfonispora thiosulfatigenes DSM 11270]|uniref:Helicase conserved C-terminal domain-containing protein n=1 Tax=Desulfonispora thiosulfatigenes DSM 11270 TaxID=656914 RepID=A0A1W1UVE3_DESTI|nr:DEAD/DEAH box helicase [Desulfonispora thiosulfatigenes]SMB85052.1 Helicase conserved C-terminal domain-containing protein [Desulfonispora thiosulfatigenes DSM 11270]
MLKPGLYELVINKELGQELDKNKDKLIQTAPIDNAESSKILAKYISEIIEKGLDNVKDNGGDMLAQIVLANKIVTTIKEETKEAIFDLLSVDERAEQLLALLDIKNNIYAINKKAEIIRPETSIAQSSLFTGAVHEPQMFTELKKEIISCNKIDMLVSFIKWSGLRLIIDELREFTNDGGKLRIITTSYMGATDVKAIEELRKLQNTEIKVSYDTKRTRLHAKTYVFYRGTGFTTAYIGSSNLSNAAISSGLEWNVKATQKDLPDTIKKINATFESYWNSTEFEEYSKDQRKRLELALKGEKYFENNIDIPYAFDINPYPYQQEILDQLKAEREVRGNYRNLIVAATGTGKTVISAFDYKNFCKTYGNRLVRILFVAHREEILKQARACFKGVLKDANFGDLFVGGHKPENIDHLFISVQTFNSKDLTSKTTPDFYDFIIIDEFHHAAAPTYQKLLFYYKPKILLGLTATPERMDGKNILEYFNNRIAAEIRLPEAINRKLLCPFQYFGVTDTVNLDSLKWVRGGYDKAELSKIYTFSGMIAKKRANMIIEAILKYVTDLNEVRGLGFCVSIEHAEFMAKLFNEHNIPSICLSGNSPQKERDSAQQKLVYGEIKFIFVVDIYNEGIDIPEVNTVLFLRPTESLTVFLQQLGRGLRLAENKDCLTVLDFIGQANKKYNFENKFAALLANSTKGIDREIKDGFISVPKGCYIQLERKAKKYILDNIRSSFGTKVGIISRIANFEEDTDKKLTLENFINHYQLDIRTIYTRNSFSRLCVEAGVRENFDEKLENILTKAFAKICAIDSRRWLSFLIEVLPEVGSLDLNKLSKGQIRMLQMFQFTVWQKSYEECGFSSLKDGLVEIQKNLVLYSELIEILKYKFDHINFIDISIDLGFDCPLDVHCKYTRDQIFVALDYLKPSVIRQGVKWLPEKNLDVFIITLNKALKDYSPTTMYNDYSINEWLFHWQSQSTTSEESITGKRYINHRKQGFKVLLFVREFNTDLAGTAPFTFLGTANYVKHEGSRPMNITWKLDNPIPAKFLKRTNKLVVG